MTKVQILDAPMGSGKTTYAFNRFKNASPLERFIYITPFLAEIERAIAEVPELNFRQPSINGTDTSKLANLKRLIEDGHNIAATHRLFEMADDELRELLAANHYVLVLDEVINVIDKARVSPSDMRLLREKEYIRIENNRVIWQAPADIYEYGVFDDIRLLSEAGTLYYYRKKYLIYAFPPSIFDTFVEIYVLTYLFDAQLMRYYFDLYSIPYEVKSLQDGEIVDYDVRRENREGLRKLINVYDGAYNDHGDIPTSFSKGWLSRRSDDELEAIKNSIYSYVHYVTKAKSSDVLWTVLQDFRHDLSGKGYTKGFLAVNARATNEYKDKTVLIYAYSRYMNPTENSFFQENGIRVSEDKLALSDMLQWIWRSNIREGGEIQIYIPSRRMRSLLEQWANYEI
ncbi:hypothetical protein JOD03_002547 [Chryseomicrobium aureum]|uniref:hypothetical protein n=1 Tax=Chryseomicrobium aureum TaxID=1441723 RepID=UPI0019577108|nr:hypothetical protein [Chryseomicrobium aureum]MBM7707600.1 hypothetical protein [Chryseomicrobium aureum]